MIRTHALRALGAAAFMYFSTVAAGAAVPASTPSPVPEIAHTVTSDRGETLLRNATRTTYVVSQEQIRRNGYRTIGDALTSVPGVEIEHYGTNGQAVSYGIRGSSSAQVLVLVDGLPAAGTLSNSVQFGTLSTVGVRRIEVIEGGGSTLYGSGAVGGIINVITDGSNGSPFVRAAAGTFGDREVAIATHGFSMERVVSNNAFALPASSSFGAPNPTTRDNSNFAGTTLRYGLDGKLFGDEASLRLSVQNDKLGTAGFFPYLSETSHESDVNQNGSFSLAHATLNARQTLQIGAERQQIDYGCNASIDTNCYQLTDSLSTEARTFATIRNVVTHESSRTIYGLDVSQGNVRADDGNGDITFNKLVQSAAYVQQSYATSRGGWYAGLRAERDGTLGGEFSPSFGIRRELGPGVLLRINAATAFRAPNSSELYFPGYGNPHLIAERARVGDVSVEDTKLLGGARLSWFTNDTRNLIVAVDLNANHANGPYPDYHPENVDYARLQGLTFDIATRPYHGVTATLALTDLYRAADVSSGARLPNDPVVAAALHLDIAGNAASRFAGAGFEFAAQGARSPQYDPTQPPFYQSGAFARIDGYARLRVARGTLLTLRGFNLGNERYAQVSGYPMPGRSLLVELSTK